MKERTRSLTKKLVSFLLVTSMAVSLLPVQAFAYIPGSEGEGRFKNMFMNSAENQRPIASYMYADNTNFFNTPTTINLSNPGGLEWMLLTFAVEKGQGVDLQLFKLSDSAEVRDGQIVLKPESEHTNPEDFLVGILNGVEGEGA